MSPNPAKFCHPQKGPQLLLRWRGCGLEAYSDFLLVLIWWMNMFPMYLLCCVEIWALWGETVSSFPQGHKSSYIKNWVIKCWTSLGLGSLGILFLFMGSNEIWPGGSSRNLSVPERGLLEKQYGVKGRPPLRVAEVGFMAKNSDFSWWVPSLRVSPNWTIVRNWVSISLLSKGMGHSDMSRNWCARVNFPSKQLRGGVNHLALGSINPCYYTRWGEQGSRKISHHRVGGSVNNKKKLPHLPCQGLPKSPPRCPLGARVGPGPSILSASIGLRAPSPIQDWRQSRFQCGPLVCISGRVPVDFSHRGGICPPGCICLLLFFKN